MRPRLEAMNFRLKIRKRKKRRLPLFILSFLVFVVSLYLFLYLYNKADGQDGDFGNTLSPPTESQTLDLVEHKEIISKGITLSDLLTKHNFSPEDIHRMQEQVKPVYDLSKIVAGQELRIYEEPDGRIKSLEYDIDQTRYLLVKKNRGDYAADIVDFPFEIYVHMTCGEVEDYLISAFQKLNEGDVLALSLSELFAWDIDFYSDVRRGDSFRVLFEKKYLNGEFVGYGNILAAEYTNQGRTFQAFRYSYPDTKKSDYFDAGGKSLRKEFLKSPIKFARITSRFSFNRLHPVRKVYRPHYGVDYAAAVGTPVQATADGTVLSAGWNGASGRMVHIRHKNAYETMYLHLRGFGSGIKKGASVHSGKVIGYVGSSGESTGPHLDYRIKYQGQYINPLGQRFQPVEPLRKEFIDDYRKEVEKCSLLLETPLLFFTRLSFI